MRVPNVFLGPIAVIATFQLSQLFLETNFHDYGEAYYKGEGHLLDENLWKGIFFVVIRQLPLSIILFYISFGVTPECIMPTAFKVLSAIWMGLILLFAGVKVYGIITWGYNDSGRTIEITLTWLLRYAGFALGYILATKGIGFGDSRTPRTPSQNL